MIQQSQNKDTAAIQLKLNDRIARHEKAGNRLVDIEHLTREEMIVSKIYYINLSEKGEKEKDIFSSHSPEAEDNHLQKTKARKK